MYTDTSTTDDYPKTLMIRNHEGGMIWQVYHVKSKKEADFLSENAFHNGFYGSTLENYQPEYEETLLDWRGLSSEKINN